LSYGHGPLLRVEFVFTLTVAVWGAYLKSYTTMASRHTGRKGCNAARYAGLQ